MNRKSRRIAIFLVIPVLLSLPSDQILSQTIRTQEPTRPPEFESERPSTPLSLEEIEETLKRTANDRLEEEKAYLTKEAAELLEGLLCGGAARVYLDGAQAFNLRKAKRNTELLVGRLINYSALRSMSTDGEIRVNRKAITRTFRAVRLCPFYPFC